jgi:putative transposase
VRVAFTLDCRDREAISWVAATGGIASTDTRDLMIESVEHRFGLVNRSPVPTEWLSDNGSPDTARETRKLARDIGLVPRTNPIESPRSNGMAEAFVKTLKRHYARVNPCSDAATVLRQLDGWFEHYTRTRLWIAPRRGFRKHLVEKTTRTRSPLCLDRMNARCPRMRAGSSPPAARSAETRSVWLDAGAAVDQP